MRRTLVAGLLLSPILTAQQEPPPKVVSGRFGFDFASQYFFRGLLQENQGVIWQPFVELGYGLHEGEGDLRKLDFKFGLWNSLHDEKTGNGAGVWYESNFYFGVEGEIGERITAGVTYSIYDSPSGSNTFSKNGAPVEELVFTFDYDDRGQLFDSLESGLQPSVVLAFEVDGQRDVATGGHVGIYLGLGVEPSFVIGKLGDGDLTFSIPATLGLSLRDYYERATGGNDDLFGYFDVGADLSAPLTFLPSRMGPWTGHAGLHCLLLGDNQEARNNGDTTEFVFTLGFETTF